jgi:hypothetical protein
VKVTRIAYSRDLNVGKYGELVGQACRLGGVRSLVWDRYGSITGVGLSDRRIRDAWMADGTATSLGVLANAWTETVRDAVADIRAHREAAKAEVRRRVGRRGLPEAERKRLYTLLTRDQWTGDPLVRRWMRQQWRRGHNHTSNQIIIGSDNVRTFTLTDGGEVWLAVPGLAPRAGVVVPPATAVAPAGTLRVVLRGGRVEVHYQVEDTAVRSAHRACGTATVGVDKDYSEVLVDTDGDHHGPELGELLRSRSDTLKDRNARRATLRSIANQAAQRGEHGTAERIRRTNLGTVTKHRQQRRWEQQVATVTYRAVSEASNPDQHRSRNRKQNRCPKEAIPPSCRKASTWTGRTRRGSTTGSSAVTRTGRSTESSARGRWRRSR